MTSISGNFGAFNALFHFNRADEAQGKVAERLSSGESFSSASEAPADFTTSNQIRSEIKAIRQIRQTNFNGVNLAQVADTTLDEVGNMIQRAMELAMWSASTASGADNGLAKQARNTEYQEILANLDQLNAETRVNDQQVFGTGVSLDVDLGTEFGNTSNRVTITTQPISSGNLGLTGTDVLTTAAASTALVGLRSAYEAISRQRADLGVAQNRIERNIDALNDRIDNNFALDSRIRDADVATEAVRLTSLQIQSQSTAAAIAQANLSSESLLQLLS